MASAYKCDRCGVLFESYDHNLNPTKEIEEDYGLYIKRIGRYSDRKNKTYDLCPKCYEELAKFFYAYSGRDKE